MTHTARAKRAVLITLSFNIGISLHSWLQASSERRTARKSADFSCGVLIVAQPVAEFLQPA
jgi:hypothetical protein